MLMKSFLSSELFWTFGALMAKGLHMDYLVPFQLPLPKEAFPTHFTLMRQISFPMKSSDVNVTVALGLEPLLTQVTCEASLPLKGTEQKIYTGLARDLQKNEKRGPHFVEPHMLFQKCLGGKLLVTTRLTTWDEQPMMNTGMNNQ